MFFTASAMAKSYEKRYENGYGFLSKDLLLKMLQQSPPPEDCRFAHSKNPYRRPLGGGAYIKIPGTGISNDFYCRVWSLFISGHIHTHGSIHIYTHFILVSI